MTSNGVNLVLIINFNTVGEAKGKHVGKLGRFGMRKLAFIVAASLISVAGSAIAGDPQGKAPGHGCTSAGAPDSKNPGQFFKTLKENDVAGGVLLGLNPNELAQLENTTPGWDGEGQTPTVGEFIQFFCDNSPS